MPDAHQWAGIAWIAARRRFEHRVDFLMTLVATLMYSSLLYMVWRATYTHQAHPRMPWSQLITYVLVGQAFSFVRFSPADRGVVYATARRIRTGDIALDLIRPVSFQTRELLEAVGFLVVEVLWVNLPTVALAVLVVHASLPACPASAIAFVLSWMLGFLVAFAFSSMVQMLSFWTMNSWGVQMAKRAAMDILAGTIIPFAFFPEWLRAIVGYLPFQAMASIPLSIYIGRIDGISILAALAQQAVW